MCRDRKRNYVKLKLNLILFFSYKTFEENKNEHRINY